MVADIAREDLMDGYVVLALLVALAVAAPRFGADSRPGISAQPGFFAFYTRS